MDKRLFLALLLTALVVVMTPIVFPGPQPVRTGADTTALQASLPRVDTIPQARREQRSMAVGRLGATLLDTPPETIVVQGGGSTYRFAAPGAAPISVALHDYPSLRPGGRDTVDLVAQGDQLLRYRLARGTDTVSLDTISMTVTRQRERDGAELIVFANESLRIGADTSTTGVTISYRVHPGMDAYLMTVDGQVRGQIARQSPVVLIDLPRTLRTAEADTLEDLRNLAYAYKRQTEDVASIGFGKLDTTNTRREPGPLTWAAIRNKYFITALLANGGDTAFSSIRLNGARQPNASVVSEGQAVVLLPVRDGSFRFQVYAGPQKYARLHALGRDLENVNPYGGWMHGFVQPFATIVMRILLWMKRTTQLNYGWVLVLFGVLVRLLIWPLNQSAMRSSIRMQRLQPQLQEIQKKYRHDPERQREALMKLYQEHGMNPFAPILGCLPMLLPMPVLFALYFVFQNTIEFRGVSFLWLPDLSLKDPFYITPLLMGLSMLLLSWIGMKGAPQTPQTKMIGYMMPAMMTVLFWNFPSGLNLYYGVQNIVALPQQWLLTRERVKASGNTPTVASSGKSITGSGTKSAKASGPARARP